jgi:hypothetical protein
MFSGYDLGAIRGSGVDLTHAGAGRVTIDDELTAQIGSMRTRDGHGYDRDLRGPETRCCTLNRCTLVGCTINRCTIKAADFVVTGINPAEFMHRQAHPNVPAGRANTSSGGKVLAFKRKGLSIASGHARQRVPGVGLGECSVAYFFSSLRNHPRAAACARLTASDSAVIVMQHVCSVAGCGNEVGQ